MMEVFQLSFSGINFVPTLFLVLVLLYWITVFVGLLDLHFLHIDFSTHTHVQIDTHAIEHHVHLEHDQHGGVDDVGETSFFVSFLSFFNLGKVPFMVLFSFFSLSVWVIAITLSYWLKIESIVFAILLLIPNFLVSLFFAKFCTMPLVKIFYYNDLQAKEDIPLEGKTGTVIIPVSSEFGQIEILINNAPIRVNATSLDHKKLDKDTKVLVIDYNPQTRCYLVDIYEENLTL